MIEKETGVQVLWVPWEGRPEGIPFMESTPEEAKERLAKHISLAERYGMTLIYPVKSCRTRLANQATLFARDQGKMKEFRNGVYEARFQKDLDIGDPRVLVSIAEQVGIDGQALSEVLEAQNYGKELDDLRQQGQAMSVEGIPTYIVDGQLIFGMDPTDEVIDAIRLQEK